MKKKPITERLDTFIQEMGEDIEAFRDRHTISDRLCRFAISVVGIECIILAGYTIWLLWMREFFYVFVTFFCVAIVVMLTIHSNRS